MLEKINDIITTKGIEQAYSSIQDIINRGDSQTRIAVAMLLCEHKCSFSEEILLTLLNDNNLYVKLEAVDSLCALQAEVAYFAIRKFCNSRYHLLRGHSILAIAYTSPIGKKNETINFIKQISSNEKNTFVKVCISLSLYLLGETVQLVYLCKNFKRYGYRNKCLILNELTNLLYEGHIKDLSVVRSIADIAKQQNNGKAVAASLIELEEALKYSI